MSQQNFFFSTIQALKRDSRIDAKCKILSFNPILDKNGILPSCGRLQFAPVNLEVEKFPIFTARKRQYSETLYRACTQHLRSPGNRASESFCAAKIPHHWSPKNTFEYKKHNEPYQSPAPMIDIPP